MNRYTKKSPAEIQYLGLPGVTQECKEAVMRLLQSRELITEAWILSNSNEHFLLLKVGSGDLVAIKSGFSSGYLGEGSRGFSYVLNLLDYHEIEIKEYKVG